MADSVISDDQQKVSPSLWLGVLGSPSVWALHLQLLYLLVKVENRTHNALYLYATTAMCMVSVMIFGCLSIRGWLAVRGLQDDTESSSAAGRQRFLCLIGIAGSSFFTLTILATGVAVYFFKPSWG